MRSGEQMARPAGWRSVLRSGPRCPAGGRRAVPPARLHVQHSQPLCAAAS